jgi:hypothetical protein
MNYIIIVSMLLVASSLPAQTNNFIPVDSTNTVSQKIQAETNQFLTARRTEEIRTECLQGRRLICGKILKVFPEGLVVESGYTNLLREPLAKSWLVRATVTASRAPNLVEGKEPGCIAAGLVFLTNLPKAHGTRPQQYDYVVIEGYPAGETTYTSIGEVKRTVRRFAATLPKAVQLVAGEWEN